MGIRHPDIIEPCSGFHGGLAFDGRCNEHGGYGGGSGAAIGKGHRGATERDAESDVGGGSGCGFGDVIDTDAIEADIAEHPGLGGSGIEVAGRDGPDIGADGDRGVIDMAGVAIAAVDGDGAAEGQAAIGGATGGEGDIEEGEG